MLDNFTIQNFRGIRELTLPKLARVNLLVGKNGVGKTSVLEAVYAYGLGCHPAVLWWILNRRGEASGTRSKDLILKSLFHEIGRDFSEFQLGGATPTLVRLGSRDDPRPALSAEDALVLTVADYNAQLGQKFLDHGFDAGHPLPLNFAVSENWSGLPLPDRPVIFVEAQSASTRIKALWTVAFERGHDHLVSSAIQVVHPTVESVGFAPVGDVPLVKLKGGTERIPLGRLGEGAERLFVVATALVSAGGGTLLIDEVENGVHYSALPQAWTFLLKAANDLKVQVFATTHSRDAVYALAEASKEDDHIVYRLSRDGDNNITAKAFDHEYLDFAVEEELEIR